MKNVFVAGFLVLAGFLGFDNLFGSSPAFCVKYYDPHSIGEEYKCAGANDEAGMKACLAAADARKVAGKRYYHEGIKIFRGSCNTGYVMHGDNISSPPYKGEITPLKNPAEINKRIQGVFCVKRQPFEKNCVNCLLAEGNHGKEDCLPFADHSDPGLIAEGACSAQPAGTCAGTDTYLANPDYPGNTVQTACLHYPNGNCRECYIRDKGGLALSIADCKAASRGADQAVKSDAPGFCGMAEWEGNARCRQPFLSPTWLPPLPGWGVAGFLQTGDTDAFDPKNTCSARVDEPVTDYGVKIFIGDNLIHMSPMDTYHKNKVISVGSCAALSVRDDYEKGMAVYADIYNPEGRKVAVLAEGKLQVLDGEDLKMTMSADFTRLVVTDARRRTLLNIWKRGIHMLQVSGVFSCDNHAPVVIEDEKPISGVVHGNCERDAPSGLAIE